MKQLINNGGTYEGNFLEGISINTTQLVIIKNSTIEGDGQMVTAPNGANVEFNNCVINGKPGNRFFRCNDIKTFIMLHCELNGSAGVHLISQNGAKEITVKYNKVKNIDGRKSTGTMAAQFIQFDKVWGVDKCEIAWNYVLNEPFNSRVEDNISTYASRGYPSNPIKIHDNLIDGGYPADPVSSGYSGGGILLGDYVAPTSDDPLKCAAYIEAYDNVVVRTTNYGLSIAGGISHKVHENIIISPNTLRDGRKIKASNVGSYVWDGDKQIVMKDCDSYNNLIGWMNLNGRNDTWMPDCTGNCKNQAYNPGQTITHADADKFVRQWWDRVAENNIVIGLNDGDTPQPKPTEDILISEHNELKEAYQSATGIEITRKGKYQVWQKPDGTKYIIQPNIDVK